MTAHLSVAIASSVFQGLKALDFAERFISSNTIALPQAKTLERESKILPLTVKKKNCLKEL